MLVTGTMALEDRSVFRRVCALQGTQAAALVVIALFTGCVSTTGRRADDVFSGTCGPSVAQYLAITPIAGSVWGPADAWKRVAARDGTVVVDVSQPHFQPYFSTIRERVRSKWVYPRAAGERGLEGNLMVDFFIAKDGRLEHVQLARSSGTAILDDAALTALKLAQPFPPVPESLCKETLGLTAPFRYEIKRGGGYGMFLF